MDYYKFKDRDVVTWDPEATLIPGGRGFIMGVASQDLPIMGRLWIIQTLGPSPVSADYPFTCFALPESVLTLSARTRG